MLTSSIIAGYFAAALVIDGVFRGASFCKYVCPIGQFQFLGSLLSPAEIRVRHRAVCMTCRTHDCIRGNSRARGCELYLFQPQKEREIWTARSASIASAPAPRQRRIMPTTPASTLIADPYRSSIGKLSKRTDVAALAGVFVFGAFVNAAAMVSPVMMWEHRWHARLGPGSMPAIVAAFVLAGVVIVPALGASAVRGAEPAEPVARRSWGSDAAVRAWRLCRWVLHVGGARNLSSGYFAIHSSGLARARAVDPARCRLASDALRELARRSEYARR